MRTDLTSIRADLAPMRMQLDSLPLDVRKLTVLQQVPQSTAFNDFALNQSRRARSKLCTSISTGSKLRTWSLPPAWRPSSGCLRNYGSDRPAIRQARL